MNHDDYSFRDWYSDVPPPYTPHPYQSNFYGDPGGGFYDPLNNLHGPQTAQPSNFCGRNPSSFSRPPLRPAQTSRPAQPLVGALDLQSELQNRMSPADAHTELYPSRPQQQERDSAGFQKKRKFVGRTDHTVPKRNAVNPNRRDAHSTYTPSSSKPSSEAPYKSDTVNRHKNLHNDSTKVTDTLTTPVDRAVMETDIEIIVIEDEESEKHNNVDTSFTDPPISTVTVLKSTSLVDIPIQISKVNDNVIQESTNNKKLEISTNKDVQTNSKNTANALMQLKLFLLECCSRKLRDKYNFFYVSDITNPSDIVDAVFRIELANTRYLYQVKHFISEYRSYKQIGYRTLVSAEFNLDMLYKVFKDNEDVDRIVISSNLGLDEQSLKKKNIKVIDNKSRYTRRIQVNDDSDLFKRMVERHSYLPKVAEYMDECMRTGKPVVLKGPIKECHVMLITENVLSITPCAGRRQIGKLHPRFINSPDDMLKPAIAQLRRHLKSLNFGKLRVNDKLIVGENFGRDSSFQRDQVEKLVQSLGIEVTIRKFFDKLEFVECEKNIEYRVLQELGPKFELIQSDAHIRVVKEELFARLRRGGDQAGLFRAIESKILSCDLKNYQQKKNVAGIKLEFELSRLENLKMVLVQNNKSTIVIKSDYPSLCALKVQQVVKGLEKYSEGRYFFLDMDDLLSAKDNLLTVFSTPMEHVLVVQAENANLKSEEVTDCLKYIRGSIASDIKRTNKIVLIQNISDQSFDFYIDVIEHREIFDKEAGLTQDFQGMLSETQCEFYGPDCANRATILKELILRPCDLTDILTSVQCVDKLVKGKVTIGEALIKPTICESTYTLPRHLKRHVVISSAALKEESQDAFFLFGDDRELKLSKVHYFKDLNSALSSYEQFVSQNKKLNAHLLKCVSVRDSHQLVWQKSSRSISSLKSYVVETREAAGQSDPIADVLACRIMIICGKSGSGKSHYLYELAHRLQTSNQNLENWVVQLNLKDSMLEQYAQCTLNSPDEAVDLLSKMLGYDELHRRLFRLSAFGRLKGKISLFVDGLEKLRKSNVHRWFQILHLLRETNISRIYVTTRLEYRKALEQTLDDFAYKLDSLTQDEQRTFLVNTWFSLANQGTVQYNWNSFVNEIFNLKELLNIINEPLYLQIFALLVWHYMKDGQKLPLMHQVYQIYTEYLDKFINHITTRTRKEIFVKSFPYLSLQKLLHPSDFRKLNLPEVLQSEDFDKLNHSSFAEYAAAKWLASLPLQQQLHAFNAIEDLAERISIVFTETFFTNNCKEFYMEYIEHVGNNRLVIQLFLRHVWKCAENTKKQEYLKEAVRTNRVRLVCELMLRSSRDVNLPADFLERITVHVISTLVDQRPNMLHAYWPLVEKLVQQIPQAAARIDSELQLPRLLSYFFARGRHEIVSKVLKSLNDHNKEQSILHTRVDGLTPLEIVNSSALMSDEQRLAISKFLIERVDSRKNVHSVMTAAARHGHIRCLEYFAGKSSEMRSNFLTNAIKTNQLDVLRFLLNDSQWTRDYNQSKNYPLHTAMTEGVSLKTLDFLLSYGGINNRNANGETALSIAIKAGTDLRIIKFLVEKEADVNVKDKLGLRPWCYAVLQKWSRYNPEQQLELMRFLKKKNASPKLPNPDDFQLTYWVKELKRKLEYLWNPESFDFKGHDATPRLHSALREQDLVWFRFLLQHGADPDVVDAQKNTALHLAVTMENDDDVLDTVRLLLSHGATFNGVDSNRKTPYDLIRSSENSADKKGEACRLLRHARDLFTDRKCIDQLKKDMTVKDSISAQSTTLYWLLNCRDARGRTLLHRAVNHLPTTDIDKLLIFFDHHGNKEGRRVSWLDARDKNGDTIVHVVARMSNHKLLREVARRGASLKARNLKLVAPRDLVTNPTNKEFLTKATELFAAVKGMVPGALQSVPKDSHSFLVKARDEAGRTLLHLAVSGRGSATRDLLCDWKANPNAVDSVGRTPLHYALMVDNLESTKLLLKVGASVDARDSSGKQPADLGKPEYRSVQLVNSLSHLLERCWRAKLSAAELVTTVETLCKKFDLESSTVVNARDCARNSMMHYVARNHEPELLRALLRRGAVYNVRNAALETPVDLAVGELKDLLGVVDDLFKNPAVAAWEAKRAAVGLDVIVNCRKAGGHTLLHTVLEGKKMQEVKWLLERGANICVTNNVGAAAIKVTEGKKLGDIKRH